MKIQHDKPIQNTFSRDSEIFFALEDRGRLFPCCRYGTDPVLTGKRHCCAICLSLLVTSIECFFLSRFDVSTSEKESRRRLAFCKSEHTTSRRGATHSQRPFLDSLHPSKGRQRRSVMHRQQQRCQLRTIASINFP